MKFQQFQTFSPEHEKLLNVGATIEIPGCTATHRKITLSFPLLWYRSSEGSFTKEQANSCGSEPNKGERSKKWGREKRRLQRLTPALKKKSTLANADSEKKKHAIFILELFNNIRKLLLRCQQYDRFLIESAPQELLAVRIEEALLFIINSFPLPSFLSSSKAESNLPLSHKCVGTDDKKGNPPSSFSPFFHLSFPRGCLLGLITSHYINFPSMMMMWFVHSHTKLLRSRAARDLITPYKQQCYSKTS